ncbi:alpha/beta fold hydrolase, partial [Mycobacterium avium]
SAAVLMGTRGRMDRARQFFRDAEAELADGGVALPASYEAKIRLLENFSRKTLNDDTAVADWIAMFSTWPVKSTPGMRAQLDVAPYTNRLSAYRSIATPVLVIGFSDDVLTPPYLGREVADALPNGRYVQIPDTGHLGFFERPDAVNAAMLKFFGEQH